MDILLEILGGIFLLILVVLAYYGWKFYRFIKRHADSDLDQALSVLPSRDLDLAQGQRADWQEQARLGALEAELVKVGAEHDGYYVFYHGQATINISLWNFKNQAVAAIYEARTAEEDAAVLFHFEVDCKLTTGSLCLTTNAHVLNDQRPPGHILKHRDTESVLELLRGLKAVIPTGSKIVKIGSARDYFEAAYEDNAEWMWRKEQLTCSKTQQTLALVCKKVSDELMETLIDLGASYSVEVNVQRARRRLASHSKMSVQQWEKIRDSLVIVNDKMRAEDLVMAVYDLSGDLTQRQEQVLEGFEIKGDAVGSPIEAFQTLLAALDLQARRLTRMESPVVTEVYLPASLYRATNA
ncbi:MAG: hypothetical protein AAF529_20585 [Pseudomonadota bacterium]